MRPKYMPVSLALIVISFQAFSSAANAVSVTNRDSRDHTLTVIEGDARIDSVLKPGASLDGVCLKGCLIRLNGSENDEYELEGAEVVSIEGGYLYYDGPEVPAAPAEAPKDGAPPPAQSK